MLKYTPEEFIPKPQAPVRHSYLAKTGGELYKRAEVVCFGADLIGRQRMTVIHSARASRYHHSNIST